MITIPDPVWLAVVEVATLDACTAAGGGTNEGYEAVTKLVGRAVEAAVEAMAAMPDRSELSVDQSTPYRLSPGGTLASRSATGWRVIAAVAAEPRFHFGQDLRDQDVAAWSPLIRKNTSGKDSL